MRRATIAFLAVTASAPALAQDAMDAQRRKAHLPYVRAATTCLAQAVESNAQALGTAATGRWVEAAAFVFPVCKPQLVDMVTVHDQLYGAGTGAIFYSGPYQADLPRALSTRVQPEIDRRVAAAEQAEQIRRVEAQRLEIQRLERENATLAETKRVADERRKVFSQVVDEHNKCINETAIKLLIYSNEPAETLSTAVLTTCAEQERKRVSMGIALWGVTKAEAERLTADAMVKRRAVLVTDIVTLRAEAVRNAATAPAPALPPGDNGIRAAKSF